MYCKKNKRAVQSFCTAPVSQKTFVCDESQICLRIFHRQTENRGRVRSPHFCSPLLLARGAFHQCPMSRFAERSLLALAARKGSISSMSVVPLCGTIFARPYRLQRKHFTNERCSALRNDLMRFSVHAHRKDTAVNAMWRKRYKCLFRQSQRCRNSAPPAV